MENNIYDVALIFEGGGMRAAFSTGIANTLLENNIYFDYASGISAGASVLLNYLSKDVERGKKSFIDIVDDPNFGGWSSFVKGKGFFNGEYIYEQIAHPGQPLPFKYDEFKNNPARFRIGTYDVLSNASKYFTNEDVNCIEDIMKIARASSSLPILMPPTIYKTGVYYDGGLCGGIALDIAIKDGYKKFFIVRTQEKSYRKNPVKHKSAIKRFFKNTPMVAETMFKRPYIYNETCNLVERLEKAGLAMVVYPEKMDITNREKDKIKLIQTYNQGCKIGQRDVEKWKNFLYSAK
ncbi:patatin-like phospholipase family protein [Peptostreptococcus canis]|uniref:Patatin family protein n=1 Tax=Peptostreptococcus canis TaxID=1159213 RepID=A0ABR6TJ71_9FIRM|nr:patatin family protein [Peptostreptococcus canis]MBC2575365.1 patatin family protein [Peptostreptococcus canis]MBP1997452.1 putative patatin/cPLA2 family phospholipase [Peptostreptococcus canis]